MTKRGKRIAKAALWGGGIVVALAAIAWALHKVLGGGSSSVTTHVKLFDVESGDEIIPDLSASDDANLSGDAAGRG